MVIYISTPFQLILGSTSTKLLLQYVSLDLHTISFYTSPHPIQQNLFYAQPS